MIPILSGNVASALPSGYDVANSCMFDGVNGYMSFAPASHMNMDRWTFSAWVKRSKLGAVQTIFNCDNAASDLTELQFDANDKLHFENLVSNSIKGKRVTTRVFRDVSAFYHIVVVWDSGNATAGDRIKIYINGVQETTFDTSDDPVQDVNSSFGENNQPIRLGTLDESAAFFSGYMAEVVILDGTAASIGDLGEYDEDSPQIWKPKDVSGLTFGSQGAYLDFEDSGDLGDDESGNGNDFTESNLAATDSATDSPTNNFCTLNPLAPDAQTFSEGNTKFTNSSGANWRVALSTIAASAGKWYCEVKITEIGGGSGIGVADMNNLPSSLATDIGSGSWSWSYNSSDGNKRHSAGNGGSSFGNSFTTNDIIGIAMDLDNNKLYFSKNGTWQNSGDPTTGSTGTGSAFDLDAGGAYAFAFTTNDTGTDPVLDINYGNPSYANSSDAADENGYGAFEYAPPSGYLALCTKNLGSDGG